MQIQLHFENNIELKNCQEEIIKYLINIFPSHKIFMSLSTH